MKCIKAEKLRADEVFYQIGKVFWLPFCIAGVWFAWYGYEKFGDLASCGIRKMCGFPCPGCGGTRAFYYLFRGDLYLSLRLNPTVIYGVLAYLHFMLFYFYRKHISHTIAEREIHIEYYLYAAIGIILLQWGIKLIRIFHLLRISF